MANKVITLLLQASGVTPTLTALDKVGKALKEVKKSGANEGLDEIFRGLKGGGATEGISQVTKVLTSVTNALADIRSGAKTTAQALNDEFMKIPLFKQGYDLAEAVDRALNPDKFKDRDLQKSVAQRDAADAKAADEVINQMRGSLK